MMNEPLPQSLRAEPGEPLLPFERQLVGWSLGAGVVFLLVLVAATRLLAG